VEDCDELGGKGDYAFRIAVENQRSGEHLLIELGSSDDPMKLSGGDSVPIGEELLSTFPLDHEAPTEFHVQFEVARDVYEGSGAEVLRLAAATATSATFDCPGCAAQVVIIAHGADLLETLVTEEDVDGFEAVLEIPPGTEFFEVRPVAELRVPPPDWTLTAG
jgi:hypothetical protein